MMRLFFRKCSLSDERKSLFSTVMLLAFNMDDLRVLFLDKYWTSLRPFSNKSEENYHQMNFFDFIRGVFPIALRIEMIV